MESYGYKECPRTFFAPFFVARKYFISQHILRECGVFGKHSKEPLFYQTLKIVFDLFLFLQLKLFRGIKKNTRLYQLTGGGAGPGYSLKSVHNS